VTTDCRVQRFTHPPFASARGVVDSIRGPLGSVRGPLEVAGTARSRRQRPEREPDLHARRSLIGVLLAATLVVAIGLGIVALRVQQVRLAYRLDGLRNERARAERLIQQLDIEVATLRAPARLESRARDLGLASPARDQVRLAREYVPGASGTAAAGLVGAEALVR
jgi:cell division protein FtsL